jgi:hypothetical protein
MLMKSSSLTGPREPRAAADTPAVVIVVKKTQGSVWSEAGRTRLCPTLAWLRESYGAGQYELRLERGNRVLCMTRADCSADLPGAIARGGLPGAATGRAASASQLSESRPASGNERARARIGLRGTALG